ncbi:alpha/beta fold hydrolase [Devosia sp. 2618]|uniref:alpha/beta hydrolase family protein n=1 Tax=Devosia sp. 2618 TaxID=3156454 RepID=UPI0033970CCF
MKMLWALSLALLTLPTIAQAADQDVVIKGTQRPIPATITLPEGGGPFPFVVMFHGTGSNRHEAGGGYDLLAPKLAEAGIASARFDFAGNGDSTVDYLEYTLTSGMQDGLDVIAYMRGLDQVDDARVGVLGWSQGGTVALLTASRNPDIKSVVTWAGAVDLSGVAGDAEYAEAQKNGFVTLEFDWRPPLKLSLDWFNEVRQINIVAELANYTGAILTIAGSKDDVVPPIVTDTILAAATASTNKKKEIIEGADHTFNIFSGDLSAYESLSKLTVDWFASTL